MASSVLMTVSRDEEERARIMRDEKIELDYQAEMNYQRRQARQEGLKEGNKEGEQRIIELLKSGKPREDIIREYESVEQK